METKKSKTANLENKKNLYFQLGLMITLASILVAFEWKSADIKNENFAQGISLTDYVEDYIPLTRPEKPVKPVQPSFELIIHTGPDDFEDMPIDFTSDIDPDDGIKFSGFIDEIDDPDPDPIPISVEEMPKFQGGDISKFVQYIMSKINYPDKAKEINLQGRVITQFVVNEKGYIENINIIRGVDPLLDNEVIQALSNSPKWKPGKQYGIPAKVRFVIPVSFKLEQK